MTTDVILDIEKPVRTSPKSSALINYTHHFAKRDGGDSPRQCLANTENLPQPLFAKEGI
jgi:hypothetical protein